jgi:hypothetical protein
MAISIGQPMPYDSTLHGVVFAILYLDPAQLVVR